MKSEGEVEVEFVIRYRGNGEAGLGDVLQVGTRVG